MGDEYKKKQRQERKVIETTAGKTKTSGGEQQDRQKTTEQTRKKLRVGDETPVGGGMPVEQQVKKSRSGKKPKKKQQESPPTPKAIIESTAFAPKKVTLGPPPRFTDEQISKMENTSGGMRSDNTTTKPVADFMDPVYQEQKNFFMTLKSKGFDFADQAGDQKIKTQPLPTSGKQVPYNDSMIQIARLSIEHLERTMEDPSYQAFVQTIYTHTMKNPAKMSSDHLGTPERMEGKTVSDLISKGMFPFMSRLARDAQSENDEGMATYATKLTILMGYLEPMHRDKEAPQALKPLVERYGLMREKLLNVMRGNPPAPPAPQGEKVMPPYRLLALELQRSPLTDYDPVNAPLDLRQAIAYNAILRERAKDDDDPTKTLSVWIEEFARLNRERELGGR